MSEANKTIDAAIDLMESQRDYAKKKMLENEEIIDDFVDRAKTERDAMLLWDSHITTLRKMKAQLVGRRT